MDKGIETLRKDLIDLIDYSLDTARLYGYADADLNHSEDDYKRGYDDACFDYNRGLADGMEDAWEVGRKIIELAVNGEYSPDVLHKIFGEPLIQLIFKHNTASEAIAKIKEYEDKQKQDAEIKVGDELIPKYGDTCSNLSRYVVTCICGDKIEAICLDGRIRTEITKYLVKTGRHFPQVAELLEQMKGESE